jgi:uncharacterized protein GlcG (DUF336 family)
MKKAILLSLALLLSTGPARAADDPAVIQIYRMKSDIAAAIVEGGIDACRKLGVNVAVAVVDRNGVLQSLTRDTLASVITVAIATQKANAAVNFNVPTSELEGRFTSPFSPGKLEGLIMSAGGVPINVGGHILGGIGVSGAPSGETDEACAQAGLDSVMEELEFAF